MLLSWNRDPRDPGGPSPISRIWRGAIGTAENGEGHSSSVLAGPSIFDQEVER
jgi:hypothetical protein